MLRIDVELPSTDFSHGQWLTMLFQMLNPSETSEMPNEGMYCLNMFAKAAYSSPSACAGSLSGSRSTHDVTVECSAAGIEVAP